MKKLSLVLLLALVMPFMSFGQNSGREISATFKFLPQNSDFYAAVGQNRAELQRLYTFVDTYKSEIRSGEAPVYVTSYAAGLSSTRENLGLAKTRASHVKSALIIKNGILEQDFRTATRVAEGGQEEGVFVTITVKEKEVVVVRPEPRPEPKPEPRPEPKPEPVVEQVTVVEPVVVVPVPVIPTFRDDYTFSISTNLLYWGALTPNLGLEWRAAPAFGIKVSGGYSNWKWSENKRIIDIWYVNPELRFYMGEQKRFYLGVGGNYADVDLKWDWVSNIIGTKGNGYEGTMWNAGLIVGYQARLAERLSLDLNIGFGYNNYDYRSYQIVNGAKSYYTPNTVNKTGWNVTQATIGLVWRIGRQ